MSKSSESAVAQQTTLIPESHRLVMQDGQEVVWLICARHTPTGRRIVVLITANDGDQAVRTAQNEFRDMDPFGYEKDWEYSVEAYDVDIVMAAQLDDTAEFEALPAEEPIPYHLTQKYGAKQVQNGKPALVHA